MSTNSPPPQSNASMMSAEMNSHPSILDDDMSFNHYQPQPQSHQQPESFGSLVNDPLWEECEDDFNTEHSPMILRAMVGLGSENMANTVYHRVTKPKLHFKPTNCVPSNQPNLTDLNRKIHDMRVENLNSSNRRSSQTPNNKHLTLLESVPKQQIQAVDDRRCSNSTSSTGYSSLNTTASRKGSYALQLSATHRLNPGSLYDPISTDVSRRSSQLSNNTGISISTQPQQLNLAKQLNQKLQETFHGKFSGEFQYFTTLLFAKIQTSENPIDRQKFFLMSKWTQRYNLRPLD